MTIIDCLVRAGAAVCVASVENSLQVTCSRGVKIAADALISEVKDFDWDLIALPGGMPGEDDSHPEREYKPETNPTS